MKIEPQQVTDPGEIELAAEISRRLNLLAQVTTKFESLRTLTALPHSQLAVDDRATGWLYLSHQVRAYLNLASDVARALHDMLIHDDRLQVPLHAHYPLLRSVIEASAQALWILQPNDHSERVQRSLRSSITELKWDEDLHKEVTRSGELYGQASPEFLEAGKAALTGRSTALRTKIRELNDTAGLAWSETARGAPTTVSVLRTVGGIGDVPGEFAASIWRLISGLTHPSASRATLYSDVEVLRTDPDGMMSARVSASLTWTHNALLVALALFSSAVQTYRIRRTKPHSSE